MIHFLRKNSLLLANGSLFLMSFTIGFVPIVASFSFVIFLVLNFLHGTLNREPAQKSFMDFLPVWGIFILYLLGLIYTSDYDYGLQIVFKSQALLLIPFVLWFRKGISEDVLQKAKNFFIAGIAMSCILSLCLAAITYGQTHDFSAFFYFNLSLTLRLHPTYLSLFILTALIFLCDVKKMNRFGTGLLIGLFVLMIILLQSRMAFFGLLLVFAYSLYRIPSKLYRLSIFILVGFLISTLFISNSLKERLNEVSSIISAEKNIGTFDEDGVNQRMWLWENGWQQAVKSPVVGYGLGSQKNLFKWQIEKKILEEELDYSYQTAAKALSKKNLHNQYLQFMYEFGILGFALFITLMLLLFRKWLKQKRYDQIAVLALFLIFLATENFFASQMGIYYFSFIICLFLSFDKKLHNPLPSK